MSYPCHSVFDEAASLQREFRLVKASAVEPVNESLKKKNIYKNAYLEHDFFVKFRQM